MPIYAYRCTSCGHAKDVLQKLSDAPLTVCPSCGAAAFSKQVTAAGFQLKGSGWYATDFKSGAGTKKPDPADGGKTDGAKTETAKTDAAKTESNKADSSKTDSSKTESGKSGDSSAPAKSGEAGASSPASGASSTPKAPGADAGR
jgi:putative FmdB family regulatory protein